MVTAKKDLFEPELQEVADLFRVLSHPARLQILLFLAETKICISGDISEELPLSRTTVNQHLKELKEAGLIRGQVEGARVNYCLNPLGVQEMNKYITKFLSRIQIEPDICC
ncbi:MAG: metalloregulator ArsR/SmtB family transcription factor [Prolixibacteraceae bacterium]